jgi:hypothetical protein
VRQRRDDIDFYQSSFPWIDYSAGLSSGWLADGRDIQWLSLYQQRIQRSIEGNLAELRTLRAERKAALDQALEEAVLLLPTGKKQRRNLQPSRRFPIPAVRFFNRRVRAVNRSQTGSRRRPRSSQYPTKPESRPPNARCRMKKQRMTPLLSASSVQRNPKDNNQRPIALTPRQRIPCSNQSHIPPCGG